MNNTSTSNKKKESPARNKSPYELLRDANIARNKKRLFDLGLDKPFTESIKKKKDCKSKSTSRKKKNDSKRENIPSSPASVSDNDIEDSSSSDSNGGFNDEEEDSSEEIKKILEYKMTSEGTRKLQIQWSTGKKEWANYDNVLQDCENLVTDFMKNYGSLDSPSVKQITQPEIEKNVNPCNHTVYEIGVTYIPEENNTYLQPKYELHGVICALCQSVFVHTEPASTKEIKPNIRNPMYTCSNRATSMKCLHSVCYECMMTEIKKASSTNGKKTLRRRH
jgi:hypothetical protein